MWNTVPSNGDFSISAMCLRMKAGSGSSQPNSISFFLVVCAGVKDAAAKTHAIARSKTRMAGTLLRAGGLFQRCEHRLEPVLAVVADVIDEEGGRPVHAAADAAAKIGADLLRVFLARQVGLELVYLEADAQRV